MYLATIIFLILGVPPLVTGLFNYDPPLILTGGMFTFTAFCFEVCCRVKQWTTHKRGSKPRN